MKKQYCSCGKCDITRTDVVYRENDILFIHAEIGCYQIDQPTFSIPLKKKKGLTNV